MTSEFEKNLEKYADVIVKIGLNLQPRQRLLIGAPLPYNHGTSIELAPLVRLITKRAYQIGVRMVEVMWDDDQLHLIRFQNAPKDSFEEYPTWRTDGAFEMANNKDAILFFVGWNPDLLKEQDSKLFMRTVQSFLKYNKAFSELRHKDVMNNLAVPGAIEGWAEKVFPNLAPEKRKTQLWDTIFEICRVKEKDPISAWKEHVHQLTAISKYLTKRQYKSLKLIAPGTNLSIGLPNNHVWQAAQSTSKDGIDFVGNIPTEEVFTLPHKDKIEGYVTATKPFSLAAVIERFKLHFSEGKIVKASAKKGEDYLHNLLETDEGAIRLGEIALVPHSSPISQTGLLFYNILLDENASSHIAIGSAWRYCLEGGNEMSDEVFSAAGGNISKIHIDFMIGSSEMDVEGILENGNTEPIMRKGEWAFEI